MCVRNFARRSMASGEPAVRVKSTRASSRDVLLARAPGRPLFLVFKIFHLSRDPPATSTLARSDASYSLSLLKDPFPPRKEIFVLSF
jgi:hypothetical protein